MGPGLSLSCRLHGRGLGGWGFVDHGLDDCIEVISTVVVVHHTPPTVHQVGPEQLRFHLPGVDAGGLWKTAPAKGATSILVELRIRIVGGWVGEVWVSRGRQSDAQRFLGGIGAWNQIRDLAEFLQCSAMVQADVFVKLLEGRCGYCTSCEGACPGARLCTWMEALAYKEGRICMQRSTVSSGITMWVVLCHCRVMQIVSKPHRNTQ